MEGLRSQYLLLVDAELVVGLLLLLQNLFCVGLERTVGSLGGFLPAGDC